MATLAEFRAMQAAVTSKAIPRSHTAVLVDGGDATSPYGTVHSRNKELTGRRVAAGILAMLYGNTSVPTMGPTFASATYGMASQGSLTVNVSFAPGTVGEGGLVWVPPTVSPWSNATRCPTEVLHFTAANCGWFQILGSDQRAYNVTQVEILGGGQGALLRLTAEGVPSLVLARGSRFGWADWPVVNVYGVYEGGVELPMVPWSDYS